MSNGAFHSYEGLPPNFSLAANMTAGAFAGIAVSAGFFLLAECILISL